MPKRVLFHREFKGFTGGHLKVFDYFDHTRSCGDYLAEIHLTPNSAPDHPWRGDQGVVRYYDPAKADILFIAGMDWTALTAHPGLEERVPVVNLVQGLRHASPSDPLYGFLRRRAIRLCVSDQVAQAITATGQCNGPIHVIPNGIDFGLLPGSDNSFDCDIFISGSKQPELALDLTKNLQMQGYTVSCQIDHLPRGEFLARMGRARVLVLLPLPEEGFFLPALEALAMGLVVICPDCVGNRAFCIDRVTALTPPLELDRIVAAVHEVARDPLLSKALRDKGKEMSLRYNIRSERETFLTILQQISQA